MKEIPPIDEESLANPIAVKMDVYGQVSRFPTSHSHRRENAKS